MPFDLHDNQALSRRVRAAARARSTPRPEAYRRFKDNPSHPSLHFKQVHATLPIYAARVGLGYRALGVIDGEAVVWFWVGTHAEYDQLLRTL